MLQLAEAAGRSQIQDQVVRVSHRGRRCVTSDGAGYAQAVIGWESYHRRGQRPRFNKRNVSRYSAQAPRVINNRVVPERDNRNEESTAQDDRKFEWSQKRRESRNWDQHLTHGGGWKIEKWTGSLKANQTRFETRERTISIPDTNHNSQERVATGILEDVPNRSEFRWWGVHRPEPASVKQLSDGWWDGLHKRFWNVGPARCDAIHWNL